MIKNKCKRMESNLRPPDDAPKELDALAHYTIAVYKCPYIIESRYEKIQKVAVIYACNRLFIEPND